MVYFLQQIVSDETLNACKITVLNMLTANWDWISMNPNIISICCMSLGLYLYNLLTYPKLYLYLQMSLFFR